ncbi:hypothetical protein [Pseudomonas parafulva]|uniref:hypothetical protein n=1 Tax=Pseudomonas parafulva TaxID=157782 RepID=UPI0013C37490|nr:hypothetical protein [Pseudomonas parafulva]
MSKLTELYDRFKDAGLADRHFEIEICSGSGSTYSQRVGELLLADYLWRDGFALEGSRVGPDFFAIKDGESVWVELHTPTSAGVPAEYFEVVPGKVFSVPFLELSLRWTSAFAEKKRKYKRYIESGIVSASDKCVIAINSALLNRRGFPDFTGTSTLPVPVEVLFGIGAQQVVIDRISGEIVGQDFEQRPFIIKSSGAPVPANSFFSDENKFISAVLGVVLCEQGVLDGEYASAMVYNPLAMVPLELQFIGASNHWVCRDAGGNYIIEKGCC